LISTIDWLIAQTSFLELKMRSKFESSSKGLEEQTESNITRTRCLLVEQVAPNEIRRNVVTIPMPELDDGAVRIAVKYSSLNYKDALCATGHPGVARKLPIIPGIDAAGIVINSPGGHFKPGQEVLVFHSAFGTEANGGYSQLIDVPAEWVYPLPPGLTLKTAMILGTAGLTAAQSVEQLIKHGVTPDTGQIIVSGATGGVGICAIKLLSKLGYDVVGSTAKTERSDWLSRQGAKQVITRAELDDTSNRPLLTGRWAGAVDTVGGNTLATIIRSTKPQGCVTACGLVGGVDIPVSVYPFILRGVTLQGIDTAGISKPYRTKLWNRLGKEWLLDDLDTIAIEVELESLEEQIQAILSGQIVGRVVVNS
jgi:putative YhdH/YhfP family quinone oxidoreductase